jgi:hypothetical protein
MNFKRNLKINWWLWFLFSVPAIIYLWLKQYEDKAGAIHSGWGDLIYDSSHGLWRYAIDPLFWNLALPLLIGWILQYLVGAAWEIFRQKRKRVEQTEAH